MNRIKIIASLLVISLSIVCIIPSKLLGHSALDKAIAIEADGFELSDNNIAKRISDMAIVIDIPYSKEIGKIVRNYISYGKTTEEMIGRSNLYFPLFESVLIENNIPLELKYLSVIESSLRADVKSRAGAAGLWQFMRTTGRHFGLTINQTIDERLDPNKSTHAAANYLNRLYKRFGNWTLAIAAYNCGPTRVNRAIKKANSRSFTNVEQYLPRETRRYVKKFVAMSYVMNYYYLHDIYPEQLPFNLGSTVSVDVYEATDFNTIKEQSNVDFDVLQFLNPSYLKNRIPANTSGSKLTLPAEKVTNYLIATGQIKIEKKTPKPSVVKYAKIESIDQLQPIGADHILVSKDDKLPKPRIRTFQHFYIPHGIPFRARDWVSEDRMASVTIIKRKYFLLSSF